MDELNYLRQFPFEFERGPLLFALRVCDGAGKHPAHIYLECRRKVMKRADVDCLADGFRCVMFGALQMIEHHLEHGWEMSAYTIQYRREYAQLASLDTARGH